MVRLVAVLQEFLLFQSEARVLTHSSLIGVLMPPGPLACLPLEVRPICSASCAHGGF